MFPGHDTLLSFSSRYLMRNYNYSCVPHNFIFSLSFSFFSTIYCSHSLIFSLLVKNNLSNHRRTRQCIFFVLHLFSTIFCRVISAWTQRQSAVTQIEKEYKGGVSVYSFISDIFKELRKRELTLI